MVFDPVNLLYFAIIAPIAILTGLFLIRRDTEKDRLLILIILSILLFVVRIFLVLFADTIGIMPYLEYDIIFYTFLTVFGVLFTIIYVLKVEKSTLQEVGWKIKDKKKSIAYGLIGYLPLIAFMPLVLLLTGIEVSSTITWEKIVLGIEFGFILGGFYEETMFRGVIQNHLSKVMSEKMTVISTALIFTATHLWYLPFTGYGIYYFFVLLMAFLLSILRLKGDLLASAILHGGIVFFLIIAI
ncbi:MAG TPA: CPBP family intramembrane glutamic endopeptidase [Candidatus Deferrimicrobium sp.]|nr:CPBP family intramembrane glutamic endopeptidase [Candidatus Deferrimicrobium sp.]